MYTWDSEPHAAPSEAVPVAYFSPPWEKESEPQLCDGCQDTRIDMLEFLVECTKGASYYNRRVKALERRKKELRERIAETVCKNENKEFEVKGITRIERPAICLSVTEGEEVCRRCNNSEPEQ